MNIRHVLSKNATDNKIGVELHIIETHPKKYLYMKDYQTEYLDFCLANKILQFGKQFTLKSGRRSPYFFNSGLFNTGQLIGKVGTFYAKALQSEFNHINVIYGPAYKGIPLVISASIALSHMGVDVKYCFNRKETKTYGDGGSLVGFTDLRGVDVVILDDVITAGLAVRESIELLHSTHGANVVGVLIALDRMEVAVDGHVSAVQKIQAEFNIPVRSIVKMDDIIEYVKADTNQFAPDVIQDMLAYREMYGVSSST